MPRKEADDVGQSRELRHGRRFRWLRGHAPGHAAILSIGHGIGHGGCAETAPLPVRPPGTCGPPARRLHKWDVTFGCEASVGEHGPLSSRSVFLTIIKYWSTRYLARMFSESSLDR